MTRRIQESNSDDGSRTRGRGCTHIHMRAQGRLARHCCTRAPTRSVRRRRRGRISMRAAPSIHAANYYRKRRNRARPGNWLPRLGLHIPLASRSPGGSFCQVARSLASSLPPRSRYRATRRFQRTIRLLAIVPGYYCGRAVRPRALFRGSAVGCRFALLSDRVATLGALGTLGTLACRFEREGTRLANIAASPRASRCHVSRFSNPGVNFSASEARSESPSCSGVMAFVFAYLAPRFSEESAAHSSHAKIETQMDTGSERCMQKYFNA